MREFLKGLELEKETIDTIMAEHGKLITSSKETISDLENKVKGYEAKIGELESKTGDSESIKNELETLKKTIEEENNKKQVEESERLLTENIRKTFGDKKFINEFTQTAIENSIKEALKKQENAGRSATEIFEELTKDKDGIFANPNQVIDIPGANGLDNDKNVKEIPTIW